MDPQLYGKLLTSVLDEGELDERLESVIREDPALERMYGEARQLGGLEKIDWVQVLTIIDKIIQLLIPKLQQF